VKLWIKLIAVFLVLLAACSLASAAMPHLKIGNTDSFSDKLRISFNPPSITVSKFYSSLVGSSRIGLVSGNVAEYKIKVKVGSGKYDYIVLTNFVQESRPWRTNIDKNIVILPGQAMTEKFYSDMAIYFAQQGFSTYILDRRETNIPSNETDFNFMKNWTIDEHLRDIYKGILASRVHTAFLSKKPSTKINLTAIGHSHGALLLTAYEASMYDDLVGGSVDKAVPVDIIIKYNPEMLDNIHGQAEEFASISETIKNGTYQDIDTQTLVQVASLAYASPGNDSPFQPGLTNMQFFRLLASNTSAFSKHPYTPDYHYWSGDIYRLYYVDENKLLNVTMNGGAVPYSPLYVDQYMAGLMGNITGYEIKPSKVDCPLLYVGLSGGFGDYGSWWYKNEVGKTNKNVSTIIWNSQGNDIISQGHASILLDNNAPKLWELINNWIKNN
jgi:hypothetical protein